MTEHPVVACYRGLDSADAVGLGARLARALGEPLVLAKAYRYDPAGLSSRALPAPANARRAGAAQAALRRARVFAGTDLDVRERVVPSAEVGDALISLAQDIDAAVLVLGRDADGHVTRSLVPRSPCPVAVAPLSVPLPQPPGFGRLGVAYDGSAFASWALVVARELTLATGAQLVVYAAGPTSERASTCLHRARLLLGRTVGFQARALVDDPAGGLTQASAELDLLVCGSRGRGRPLAAILGSVSAHLVAHAQCPVLVVPPGVWRSETSPLAICSAAALL